MVNKIKISAFILLFACFSSFLSAMDIKKEVVAAVPEDLVSKLIGLRVYKNQAFVMASNGKYITVDLSNGKITSSRAKIAKVIDYDVAAGKIVCLDEQGKISGYPLGKLGEKTYDSCRIETCDQGVILSGGDNSYFLPQKGKAPSELKGIVMPLPIYNGFLWAMSLNKERCWELNLHDCFGNFMDKVYKFSNGFEPSNLEIGPAGIDGDLLVSAKENKVRKIALIGRNGRMFWKINGPAKICSRDLAFGPLGELLVLEKNPEGKIILSRWTFTTPQG